MKIQNLISKIKLGRIEESPEMVAYKELLANNLLLSFDQYDMNFWEDHYQIQFESDIDAIIAAPNYFGFRDSYSAYSDSTDAYVYILQEIKEYGFLDFLFGDQLNPFVYSRYNLWRVISCFIGRKRHRREMLRRYITLHLAERESTK